MPVMFLLAVQLTVSDVFLSIVRGLAGSTKMRQGMKGDWTQCWWRRCELCIHGVLTQREREEWKKRREKDWERLKAFFISWFTNPQPVKDMNSLKRMKLLFPHFHLIRFLSFNNGSQCIDLSSSVQVRCLRLLFVCLCLHLLCGDWQHYSFACTSSLGTICFMCVWASMFSFTTLDTVRTGRPLSSATGMLQQGKHLTKPFSPICGQSVPVLNVFFSLLSHVLYVKLELLFGCICNDMLTYLSFNTSPKLLIQLLTAFWGKIIFN